MSKINYAARSIKKSYLQNCSNTWKSSRCLSLRNCRSHWLFFFRFEGVTQTQHHAKKKSAFYTAQDRQTAAQYLERIKDISNEKRVYIDETGIQTQIYRQYARSPRGKRGNIRIRGKRHARIGLVAAQCEGKLIAPLTYIGAMKVRYLKNGLNRSY